VTIRLNGGCTRAQIEALWELLASHPGDRPLTVEIEVQGQAQRLRVSAEVTSRIRVRPSSELLTAVERLCGSGSVTLR
jgi:hypothetical protein